MEQEVLNKTLIGLQDFMNQHVDFVFIIFFMLVTTVFSVFKNKQQKDKTRVEMFLEKMIPKAWRVFIFGLITGWVYIWMFDGGVLKDVSNPDSRKTFGDMLISVMVAMLLHKLLLDKLIKKYFPDKKKKDA